MNHGRPYPLEPAFRKGAVEEIRSLVQADYLPTVQELTAALLELADMIATRPGASLGDPQ